MKRLLIQTQLSNYDTDGMFILEADSGWQMVMGRVRQMLKLNSELHITVMGPICDGDDRQVITHPRDVNPDLWEKYGLHGENRLHYYGHKIIANALVTRYDLDWRSLARGLDLNLQKIGSVPKWDAVYINDPMHLRNFKALFFIEGGYQPRFYVHSHFIDNPECPKFPTQASLWLGQCEAAIKADFNFWQCGSSMDVFFESMGKQFHPDVVDSVRAKSLPWDDGYSSEEINTLPNMSNVRFDIGLLEKWKLLNKPIIFVPNRIGGQGRSSDYTNCGKFMFELLPQLHQRRQDFVVIAGNPSQKFSNSELETQCGPFGYVNLVPNALNRDEFKLIARYASIAVGLYDQDSYGGTVARECIELDCWPLWLDRYEYANIAKEAGGYPYLAKDWSDIVPVASRLLDQVIHMKTAYTTSFSPPPRWDWMSNLQRVVWNKCSYEATTLPAMKMMNLL